MRKILLTTLLFFIIKHSYATNQLPDLLIIKNDTVYLHSFPLYRLNLDHKPFKASHTACRRGYQAIWKILDNKLYLAKIIGCDFSENKDNNTDIKKLFDSNNIKYELRDNMIFANWVTTDLFSWSSIMTAYYPNRIELVENQVIKNKNQFQDLKLMIIEGKVVLNKLKK